MSQHPTTPIPTRLIGPIKISGEGLQQALIQVPMATYESTLWPSTARGARVSCAVDEGIRALVQQDIMTRSILLRAQDVTTACVAKTAILQQQAQLAAQMAASSRFLQLHQLHIEVVGNLLFIRLECQCADAAGHNMTTKAADYAVKWILEQYPQLQYSSLSANYCCDKKVSAINGIRGRGKHSTAEILIPAAICQQQLRTSAQQLVDLHVQKNLIGSILAGSVRSANAHFANILLAIYLATGQDAANIVEGSQGITHAEVRGDDLYFSVTLPNIIVGTVGNGKGSAQIQSYFKAMQCTSESANTTTSPQLSPGIASRRFAAIIASTVLCGELSLLAALTQPRELMRAHELYERQQQKSSQRKESQTC